LLSCKEAKPQEATVPIQLPPIDDDVYAALQSRAVPLEDDINSVLRRLLGLGATQSGTEVSVDGDVTPSEPPQPTPRRRATRSQKPGRKRTRVPKGSILPETEYEIPILRALAEMGGRGPTSEVIALVEKELGPKLTDVDRGKLSAGDVRWKNRAQFVRLKLVEKGEMASGSPRGTWEISDLGRKRLEVEG
jgi:hypothetical protein